MEKENQPEYDVFLICPVRGITEEKKTAIRQYVEKLEDEGLCVYWPLRDTDQNDPVGLHILLDNIAAIRRAKEVRVWYDLTSEGSRFDIGVTLALKKRITLANPEEVLPTKGKSFANVLLELHRLNSTPEKH